MPKTLLILSIFLLSVANSYAQCAMCRAALQSEETGLPAEAVNDGIVYLMVFPYLLFIAIGYAIYRMSKAKKSIK